MKKWNELSIREKAAFIKAGVNNGLTSIDDIQKSYNEYTDKVHLFDGKSEPTQQMKNQTFWSTLTKNLAMARDAKVGAIGADQVRQLAIEGNTQEAQNLAKKYAKANTVGIALAGGAASSTLLGDLATTIGTTALDATTGQYSNLTEGSKDLITNIGMDLLGKGISKIPTLIKKVNNNIQLERAYQQFLLDLNRRDEGINQHLFRSPNEHIFVHGDPAATGNLNNMSPGIATQTKIRSEYPYIENGILRPGKHADYTEYAGGHEQKLGPSVLFSSDRPFYETREKVWRDSEDIFTGDITDYGWELFGDRKRKSAIKNYIKKGDPDYNLPTTGQYRYIAVKNPQDKGVATLNTMIGRSGQDEWKINDIPSDFLNGLEWDPIIGTWSKVLYSPNAQWFLANGGPLSDTLFKPFSYNPLPAVRFANGGSKRTRNAPVLVRDENLAIEGILPQQLSAMRTTWDYLTSKGISPRNAAAIMGNMMQESSFNPEIVQRGGDNAIGYFQMHGQRLRDYNSYLKEKNLKNSDLTQLDYMIDVINGNRKDFYIDEYNRVKSVVDSYGDPSKLTGSRLTNYNRDKKYFDSIYGKREKSGTLYPISALTEAYNNPNTSLNDATDLFTNTIERAGKPEYEKRQSYANSFYRYFYGVPQK